MKGKGKSIKRVRKNAVENPKKAIEAIRSIPLLSDKDIAQVRAALCGYDPNVSSRQKMLRNLEQLPGITGEDLARVKAALCLYDPVR